MGGPEVVNHPAGKLSLPIGWFLNKLIRVQSYNSVVVIDMLVSSHIECPGGLPYVRGDGVHLLVHAPGACGFVGDGLPGASVLALLQWAVIPSAGSPGGVVVPDQVLDDVGSWSLQYHD